MKRITALLLALVMVVAFCVPALAESSTELIFEYEDPNQNVPSYTVTVPETVYLSLDGTPATFEAEDVENIPDGQKVSVTIASTSNQPGVVDPRGLLQVGYRVDDVIKIHSYTITRSDGGVITHGNLNSSVIGKEVCSFTEDGADEVIFKAVLTTSNVSTYGTYTGSLTYGIELVDA